jgi:putative ABC transport system permease protein
MFRNYLKTTLRNLWRQRGFSLLNICGLGIGIACAILIFLWVEQQYAFNGQFEKKDLLYKVSENQTNNGKIVTSFATPGPLGKSMLSAIPGISNAGRLSWGMDQLLVWREKSVKDYGVYADSSILSMLTLKFVHGNLDADPAGAFRQERSLIISETLSKKLFGNVDPVGKTIEMKAKESFSADGVFAVAGVYRDFGVNSSFPYQWIAPYAAFENKNGWLKPWNNDLTTTLVELAPSADRAAINKVLAGYLSTKRDGAAIPCFLFAMNDWHLRDHFTDGRQEGGLIRYITLFSLVAGIVLLIACINFMNLATARCERRAREVGVRKVMGASRGGLVNRFIGESLLMSFLAVSLAVMLVYATLPVYNRLLANNLSFDLWQLRHLLGLAAIGLITGLLAGSYPAFYLSSFQPVKVLKGFKSRKGDGVALIRKGLVITQFAVSIVFIICTVIIYQQVQHVRQRDLGYNKDRLLYMNIQGDIQKHFQAVRDRLLATGVVENASLSLHDPLHVYGSDDRFSWEGKDPHRHQSIFVNNVSPEYLSTMHMRVLAGRDFYPVSDMDSLNLIINASMATLMGRSGKVGAIITVGKYQLHVVGIIKDFVYNDMYGQGEPLILLSGESNATVMEIRLRPGVDLTRALAATTDTLEEANPGYPVDLRFVDQDFAQQFSTEELIGSLARIFAVLAIFISCLGLFGLAAYTAERRTKEIGIRKVLGASARVVAALLSKDFLQLVSFSCLIAFPVAWWAMHSWLGAYAYRTVIEWWVFAVAGLAALAVALITVSFQAIRAALTNPVKALRAE